MLFDPDTCYRALLTRDTRFDGRFFVAVSSTGIYCRPVCAVRTPRRENCAFYDSAAGAEAAGYRPCLRCRPELAPGRAPVDAASRLAQAAAQWIDDGMGEEDSLAALARRLGVTDRHLRRVFHEEFGVTPVAYAQTRRLLLAKQLLTDTVLPVTELALAAGFGSLRRFNALFQERYRLTPSDFRRQDGRRPSDDTRHGGELRFLLGYRPPYDWEAQMRFLANRAVAGAEQVIDGRYRRAVVLSLRGHPLQGCLEVAHHPERNALAVTLTPGLLPAIAVLLGRVRRLFDLSCDPQAVAGTLGPLARAAPGLRVPGAFDGFEAAARAVLGQQITVSAARTLAGRLTAAWGAPVTGDGVLQRAFPDAATIAAQTPEAIAALGLPRSRAATLVRIAQAIAAGELDLSPQADVAVQMTRLRALPGIGEWTAQYLALRALSWPDAFPAGDAGIRRALGGANAQEALARAEAWRPWRAYAALHLWHSLELEIST